MRSLALAALFIVLAAPALAAPGDKPAPRGAKARAAEAAKAQPAVTPLEAEAAKARAATDARNRAWDDKMKRTMRSICSGATGC